jgi:tetratricopeptide (TPR) repeat protein
LLDFPPKRIDNPKYLSQEGHAMSSRQLAFLLALGMVQLPAVALACLWDYDTLLEERTRFPDTIELITGKFLRHSQEFYRWRIQDRLQKIKGEPDNLAYYDDLAVAYEKIGNRQTAIETMLVADRKQPGRYETVANLGTFYIHSGQLDPGLKYIDQALRINPNAHFGREKYQHYLVEYILACRQKGINGLPLQAHVGEGDADDGFPAFLITRLGVKALSEPTRKEAIKGLLGMMRFGNHESPILLEVLANLLSQSQQQFRADAKRLSASAYLKASYSVPDQAAARAYRGLAGRILFEQTRVPNVNELLPLEELEETLRQQIHEADVWYEGVRKDELSWITSGKNPEREYTRKYYGDPVTSGLVSQSGAASGDPPQMTHPESEVYWTTWWRIGTLAGGIVLGGLGLYLLWYVRIRAPGKGGPRSGHLPVAGRFNARIDDAPLFASRSDG